MIMVTSQQLETNEIFVYFMNLIYNFNSRHYIFFNMSVQNVTEKMFINVSMSTRLYIHAKRTWNPWQYFIIL